MVAADRDFRPIVVITSNSEKSLPDPFLRRCAYFDIPFPRRWRSDRDGPWPGTGTLEQIIDGRIDALSGGGTLVSQALDFFDRLRKEESGVRKRPGTAELLAWLDILVHLHGLGPHDDLIDNLNAAERTLGAVLKSKDDLEIGLRLIKEWASSTKATRAAE
jgi:MoxR-like ATPase